MRVIEVALRHSTLGYEIPLSISNLFLRREYGSVQKRAVEKRRNQTSNLGVGGSNPSERATPQRSVPDTWVTFHTGDMGNTLVVSLSLMGTGEAARSLRRY
jgi:hypothetical protein